MIKKLTVKNISSSCGKPAGLSISGIHNRFISPHKCSWNPSTNYATVLTPGANEFTFYESGSTASPHLEAIHGIGDWENIDVNGKVPLNVWGSSYNRCISILIPSDTFVMFMYSLIDLSAAWIKNNVQNPNGPYPPGMSEPCFQELKAYSDQWKESTFARELPTDIYQVNADLTDDYIGGIISILAKHGGNAIEWAVSQENLFFRVPEVFVKFVSQYYEQTISSIIMTSPDKIFLQAEYNNDQDADILPAKSNIFFDVNVHAFVPRLIYICKPDVEQILQ